MNNDLEPEGARSSAPGTPRTGWFAGVLEGHVGEQPPLRAAVRKIEALEIVGCDLEVDGGRFSFLFDEAPVAGSRLTEEAQNSLVEGLQGLVAASSRPELIESTLRCSLLYDTEVVETLFSPAGGELVPISRRRPIEERDQVEERNRGHASAHADGAGPAGLHSLGHMGRRRGLLLLLLFLVGGSLYVWKSGYVALLRDAFQSNEAESLEVGLGPFRDTLSLTVVQRFAAYECKLTRGPNYPLTAAAVDALVASAVTAEDRAAANAVGDGGMIWIRLLASDGETLEAVRVSLRSLLTDADGVAEAKLRTRLLGERVDLALASGLGKRTGEDEQATGGSED